MSHTPGPWRRGEYDEKPWDRARMEADADLIAAAPDMLAALELVESSVPWGTIPVAVNGPIYAAVRAAIAKARGTV